MRSGVANKKFVDQGWGPLLLLSVSSLPLSLWGLCLKMHMDVTVGDLCENVAVFWVEISIHKVTYRNVMPTSVLSVPDTCPSLLSQASMLAVLGGFKGQKNLPVQNV